MDIDFPVDFISVILSLYFFCFCFVSLFPLGLFLFLFFLLEKVHNGLDRGGRFPSI